MIRRSCAAAMLGIALLSTTVRAQSFNIDFGPPGSTPPPATYAAAGSAGQWISLVGTQSTLVTNLTDVDGTVTAVTMNQIGGTETVLLADPAVGGDDATLMNDCLVTHTAIENCLFFGNMQPGRYDVYIYARMPGQPTVNALTNVDQEDGNPHLTVGGAWPGGHAAGVSYSRHTATVVDSGAQAGKLWPHSGMASGTDPVIGAALNGIQIEFVPPPAGDFDGDYSVGFTDLNQLLARWGSCVDCVVDLDGNGQVGFVDLNILLGNWGAG